MKIKEYNHSHNLKIKYKTKVKYQSNRVINKKISKEAADYLECNNNNNHTMKKIINTIKVKARVEDQLKRAQLKINQ
jgi:hypothetical protein